MSSDQQHQAWVSGQAADEYFLRNRSKLDAESALTRATRFLASHIRPTDKVLEIGTANGRVLEQLRRLTGCVASGVDPSPAAIADGSRRYPELRLSVGSADHLPWEAAAFDVVILGFCLYLVDRALLPSVVAQTDRVLADGGRLMITDFDPPSPRRREFAHQPGLWSYKLDYTRLWLANPQYVLAERIAYSHSTETFHADPDERVASSVLIKQPIAAAYPNLASSL